MTSLLIIGTGYTSQTYIKNYRENYTIIYGVIKSSKKENQLKKLGIKPIILDIITDSLNNLPKTDYVLISPSAQERKYNAYKNLYLDGIQNVIHHFQNQKSHPKKIISLSSTGVWENNNGNWIDEDIDPKPSNPLSNILYKSEKQVLLFSNSIILRLGGIYGLNRNRIDSIKENSLPSQISNRYINLIHVEDVCRAIHLLFEKGKLGDVYHGVDDYPVLQIEYFDWLFEQLKMKNNIKKDISSNYLGKRCRNEKIKKLGLEWIFPNFKKGYQEILNTAKL